MLNNGEKLGAFIVPTGIGASIGGYAGDASCYAKKFAKISNLIVNPNVVNAGCFSGITENMFYVEGYSLDEFFKGNMVFINMMCNMSVDCDCCAVAEDPCMKDIGILASLDPVAIDQACIDLVKNSNDPGKAHFLERVESRHGTHTIDMSAELGFGTKEYELINLD